MSMREKLAAGVRRTFPGTDLALWAAGATYFGVIGLVPLALSSLWAVGALVGHDAVTNALNAAIDGLPSGHGTPDALRTLTWVVFFIAWATAEIYPLPLRVALPIRRSAYRCI